MSGNPKPVVSYVEPSAIQNPKSEGSAERASEGRSGDSMSSNPDKVIR